MVLKVVAELLVALATVVSTLQIQFVRSLPPMRVLVNASSSASGFWLLPRLNVTDMEELEAIPFV